MTAPALLWDTGALLDYLSAGAPDHAAFRGAIDSARARYIPGLVLAEVDYFLRNERKAMAALMRDLARGAFTYAGPTLGSLARAMEIEPVRGPRARARGRIDRRAGGGGRDRAAGDEGRAPLQRGQAEGRQTDGARGSADEAGTIAP